MDEVDTTDEDEEGDDKNEEPPPEIGVVPGEEPAVEVAAVQQVWYWRTLPPVGRSRSEPPVLANFGELCLFQPSK